jgi:hypothetical protein
MTGSDTCLPISSYAPAHARTRKRNNRKCASGTITRQEPAPFTRPTRAGLTQELIEAYEWALTLRDADAAVYAVLAIAELNGILIDSVEIQYEIQATLAQIEKA